MAVAVERLRGDIDEIMPGVIADRRQFHENPELGFQEFETAKIVAEERTNLLASLRAMGSPAGASTSFDDDLCDHGAFWRSRATSASFAAGHSARRTL